MKFTYGFKTKENVEQYGEVFASSRDAAFRELRKRGVKPFRVDLAPGFANWLLSLGKRTYAIVALVILCLSLCAVVVQTRDEVRKSERGPQPRHQIYGDPALMAELERTDYAALFGNEGDRFLAHYICPGQLVKEPTDKDAVAANLHTALAIPDAEAVVFGDSDTREEREIKQIVLWLRAELRRYLEAGTSSAQRYIFRLGERQMREASLYYNAKNDLEKETDQNRWDRINESLRNAGLPTIPLPAKGLENGEEKGVTQMGEKN